MRNRPLAAATLFAALAAACRRAPPPAEPAAGPGVSLEAPAPSSTVVTSPLAAAGTGFTNEMQAQNLREQAADLGISRFTKISESRIPDEDDRPPISYQEGLQRTKAYERQFEAARRQLDRGKPKTVAIPGETPRLLPGSASGTPVETSTGEAGPKGPENR